MPKDFENMERPIGERQAELYADIAKNARLMNRLDRVQLILLPLLAALLILNLVLA